jgi:hypothetical protein
MAENFANGRGSADEGTRALAAAIDNCADRDAINAIASRLSKPGSFMNHAGDFLAYALVGRDRFLKRDLCNMEQDSGDWVKKAESLGMSGSLNEYLRTHPIYPGRKAEK